MEDGLTILFFFTSRTSPLKAYSYTYYTTLITRKASLVATYRGKVMKFNARSDFKCRAEMDWIRHYVTKVIVPHELLSRLLQLSLKRGYTPD